MVGDGDQTHYGVICVTQRMVVLLKKVTNTRYSQAVSHQGTNQAWPWLTSVIRRELVLSWQYGR